MGLQTHHNWLSQVTDACGDNGSIDKRPIGANGCGPDDPGKDCVEESSAGQLGS